MGSTHAGVDLASSLSPLHNTSKWFCPHTIVCTEGRVSYDIGTNPSYLAIASSVVSCLGSALIILVYFCFKDLRSSAQKIITYLAVADMISAVGYIGGSINFLVHFNHSGVSQNDDCKIFNTVCEIQASVTSWSSLVSFSWTVTLALYFYLVMIYSRRNLASRLMPLYHVMGWVVPLFIIIPLAALKKLGYSPYAASNWCFVKHSPVNQSKRMEEILFVFLAGKFWEILSYIMTIYVYVHIATKLIHTRRHYQPQQRSTVIEKVERRLLYIPASFVALRIWGTLQFFYSLAVYHSNHNGCIPSQHHTIFMVLGYLQAVGDPGQGWGNAIVYVLLSPMVRRKLMSPVCVSCLVPLGRWFVSLNNTTHNEGYDPREEGRGLLHNSLTTDTPQVLKTARSVRPVTRVGSCDIMDTKCGSTSPTSIGPKMTHHQNKMHSTFLN